MANPDGPPEGGKYFYAVIFTHGDREFGNIGLDSENVYTILHRDIAAVVSDHPVTSIRPLRRNLSPFHLVLRSVSETCTTIPAKFGQLAADAEQVLQMLRSHYGRLKQELERLHAKGEIGVKVFWEVDNLSEYFLRTDGELRRLRDRILARGSPPTRQEQIDLGGLIYDRISARKGEMTQMVVTSLRSVAAEVRVDEATEERMVTNAAFLVGRERRSDFEEAVGKTASLLGQEYVVKVDGPWPPFSFVTHIELRVS
ncbi:MAG: GvpL/GvpF family gas vesicle protein [Nitrospinae bacterium]|nr:GvpL/GvpF family gas vesicle protein [Nitrospinota bacterium]